MKLTLIDRSGTTHIVCYLTEIRHDCGDMISPIIDFNDFKIYDHVNYSFIGQIQTLVIQGKDIESALFEM